MQIIHPGEIRSNYIPCYFGSFAVCMHLANKTFRPGRTVCDLHRKSLRSPHVAPALAGTWMKLNCDDLFFEISLVSTELFQTWLSESETQFFHFSSCFKKVSGQEIFSACAHLTLLSRVLMDSALCGLRNAFPNNCLGMPSCCRDDSRWDYNSLTSCPPPLSFSFFCSPFLNTFHCNQIFFPMFCQHRWSNNGATSLLLLLCKITVYPFILWNGSLDKYTLLGYFYR